MSGLLGRRWAAKGGVVVASRAGAPDLRFKPEPVEGVSARDLAAQFCREANVITLPERRHQVLDTIRTWPAGHDGSHPQAKDIAGALGVGTPTTYDAIYALVKMGLVEEAPRTGPSGITYRLPGAR